MRCMRVVACETVFNLLVFLLCAGLLIQDPGGGQSQVALGFGFPGFFFQWAAFLHSLWDRRFQLGLSIVSCS